MDMEQWQCQTLLYMDIFGKGVERTRFKNGLVSVTFGRNLPCYRGSPAGLKSGSRWSCERETWIGADTLQLFHSGALGHCNSPTKSRPMVALVQQRWYICSEILYSDMSKNDLVNIIQVHALPRGGCLGGRACQPTCCCGSWPRPVLTYNSLSTTCFDKLHFKLKTWIDKACSDRRPIYKSQNVCKNRKNYRSIALWDHCWFYPWTIWNSAVERHYYHNGCLTLLRP